MNHWNKAHEMCYRDRSDIFSCYIWVEISSYWDDFDVNILLDQADSIYVEPVLKEEVLHRN